jgi:hypothetical protein
MLCQAIFIIDQPLNKREETGRLLGFSYGVDTLPGEWRECFAHADMIKQRSADAFETPFKTMLPQREPPLE